VSVCVCVCVCVWASGRLGECVCLLYVRVSPSKSRTGEAGGITQQIGATFFPIENILKLTAKLRSRKKVPDIDVPGLLVIGVCVLLAGRSVEGVPGDMEDSQGETYSRSEREAGRGQRDISRGSATDCRTDVYGYELNTPIH